MVIQDVRGRFESEGEFVAYLNEGTRKHHVKRKVANETIL